MKRSEALEQIRKILAMNGKDDGNGELEEVLLHTMEEVGMLPPFVDDYESDTSLDLIGNRWELAE
jgi:hypothetical protein